MVKCFIFLFFILTNFKCDNNNLDKSSNQEVVNENISNNKVTTDQENKDLNNKQTQDDTIKETVDGQAQITKIETKKTHSGTNDFYEEVQKLDGKYYDANITPKKIDFTQYQDGDTFQKEQFRCLLFVIYENTLNLSYLQMDSYLEDIKKIVKGGYDNDFNLMSLFNTRIINAINNLFIHFSNLNSSTRGYIINKCFINISETKKRCEETFKKDCHNDLDFELENPFAFNVRCRDLIPQKSNQKYIRSYGTKCYHECPLFYKELYNKCEMPQAYENKLFSSFDECQSEKFKSIDPVLKKLSNEHNIKIECIPFMNFTFYIPQCLPGFQRQFYLFCIPDCPNGMIPSEKYCLKRNAIEIPNNISFNFSDLFLNEVNDAKTFNNKNQDPEKIDMDIISKQSMEQYRKSIQQKKIEIELQNKS